MIDGVIIKKLNKFKDDRGWLAEIYRNDETNYKPAMAYFSESRPGAARGPHEHKEQTDFFIFIGPGKFRVYFWDNRKASPTFGEKMEIDVGGEEINLVIVPPGVVHGYKCVSEIPALCLNLPDKLYRGAGKNEEVDEVRWEDMADSPFQIPNS
jgi:dTDP-4-dehydrorhamnose 3,5-epimerase